MANTMSQPVPDVMLLDESDPVYQRLRKAARTTVSRFSKRHEWDSERTELHLAQLGLDTA